MSDYTPTTEYVREMYAEGGYYPVERAAEFDRFLAAHDEQVRADERERIARAIEAVESQHALNQALLPRLQAAHIARTGGNL